VFCVAVFDLVESVVVLVRFENGYESGSGESRTAVDTFCWNPRANTYTLPCWLEGALLRWVSFQKTAGGLLILNWYLSCPKMNKHSTKIWPAEGKTRPIERFL